MKITRKELVSLYKNLDTMGNLTGVKFGYFVVRNRALIWSVIKEFNKKFKPSKEFGEFEDARVALAEKFSQKDEAGEPVTKGNNYVMADQAAFDIEIEKLKKEYKKAIDTQKKLEDEYIAFLDEDVDVKVHTIPLVEVPEAISVRQMQAIEPLIEDGDSKTKKTS